MGAVRTKSVEVYSERSRVPADGGPTKLYLRFMDNPGPSITLRLNRGSFDPEGQLRQAEFPVENGEVHLTVYAPHRPGVAYLTGENIRHRIDFVARSLSQSVVYEWVPTLAISLLLAFALRSYAVASFFIPSGSMEDTLRKGDLLIADKFSYKLLHHEPQRGDVMIFQYPEDKKLDYIKRVIGLPGDIVEVRDGEVYVNGKALDEEYIKEEPIQDFGPEPVPANHYFVMGDNRNHSSDSRVWGWVPKQNFEGRALFVFWPPQRAKVIRNGLEGDVIPSAEELNLGGGLR
jgi:signal peptidase I